MSSLSDASLIVALNNASIQLNRYFGIFIFLFGIVGNTLNACVLSQGALRSNPCAWLFFASSIANGIGILAGLTSRPLSTWSADLTNTNRFLCKLRAFLLFNAMTIGSWLILLATVDRWLSSHTNANRRKTSTLKNAQLGTILILIVSTIIEAQQFYCFEANLTNTPLKCYTQTQLCGIVSDLFFALITILVPLILMIIFGFLTVSNVRKSRFRLHPTTRTMDIRLGQITTKNNTGNTTRRKKIDRPFMIMLFAQVFLIFLLTFPMAIGKLYTTVTRSMLKSQLQITIESFIFNLFLLFVYMSCGMPFYIYTLSGGSVFRKALFSFLKTLGRKMMCRRG
ncbi:unnamed protein product [Rotaria sp. Silwood2]|nr:unnamed protein product [Rotaria sp. Silwood2]CAF2879256.1 unnamed protein product [Rotaria sp. Silwood2]CAF3043643.1 unnamed protein product [Rotaria sp. Silwood2]CAF3412251.1 unnamed protein product [Rotaria sp. Silwood2]CAF4015393.1 unnamed protein product [Rotaria sp. Silwood2]